MYLSSLDNINFFDEFDIFSISMMVFLDVFFYFFLLLDVLKVFGYFAV